METQLKEAYYVKAQDSMYIVDSNGEQVGLSVSLLNATATAEIAATWLGEWAGKNDYEVVGMRLDGPDGPILMKYDKPATPAEIGDSVVHAARDLRDAGGILKMILEEDDLTWLPELSLSYFQQLSKEMNTLAGKLENFSDELKNIAEQE